MSTYTRSMPVSRYYKSLSGSYVLSEGLRTFTGVRSGLNLENWKDKIARGENASTPYTADLYDMTVWEPGSISTTSYRASTGLTALTVNSGIYLPVDQVLHLLPSTVQAQNEALSKAIRKVKAVQSELNGWTFLGELRETIGMLRRPAAALRNNVESYLTTLEKRKRGIQNPRSPGGRRALQSILSGTWLEAQFGWKPAISDAKAIATAIGKQLDASPSRKRVVASASETSVVVGVNGQEIYLPSGLKIKLESRFETKAFCTYTVGLQGDIGGPIGSVERLKKSLGFTPENFIPALWEVLPWSFLIDYFSNIGDIIEAAAFSNNNIIWTSRVTGRKSTASFNWRQLSAKAELESIGITELGISGGFLGKTTVTRTTFERDVPQGLGIPSLNISLPGKVGQHLNMLALFAQRGRKFAA